jgi:hypothetical protein
MSNPTTVVCPKDVWTKVATAVVSARIYYGATAGVPPTQVRMTYRTTGGAAPVNDVGVVLPLNDRDGGQPSHRAEHGEAVDIYLMPRGNGVEAIVHEPVGGVVAFYPLIMARCTGLDIKTDEQDKSGVLNGSAAKYATPIYAIFRVTATAGALNQNGTVNVGTGADGANILAAVALTGLNAIGVTRQVPIPTLVATTIKGDDTLHANVEFAETGAGSLQIEVDIVCLQTP